MSGEQGNWKKAKKKKQKDRESDRFGAGRVTGEEETSARRQKRAQALRQNTIQEPGPS